MAVVASTYVFQGTLAWIVKPKGGVVIHPVWQAYSGITFHARNIYVQVCVAALGVYIFGVDKPFSSLISSTCH